MALEQKFENEQGVTFLESYLRISDITYNRNDNKLHIYCDRFISFEARIVGKEPILKEVIVIPDYMLETNLSLEKAYKLIKPFFEGSEDV